MRAALPFLLAAALSSAAAASTPRQPNPGSAERAEIMDAVRAATGSTSVFIVAYLRVADASTGPFAYAEVKPQLANAARPFDGWMLLHHENGAWKALWGAGDGGSESCKNLSEAYDRAVALTQVAEISSGLFSPKFLAERADLQETKYLKECHSHLVVANDS